MEVAPPRPFPAVRDGSGLLAPASLRAHGIGLRRARDTDIAFLRGLHHALREDELAAVAWPVAHKQAFLDSQFELQHTDYISRYPNADFLLIEQQGQPIGRFYRLPAPPDHLLIDITLAAHARRQGIGRGLIEQAQCEARQGGCGMRLHVRHDNIAARRLYQRLGFAITEDEGAYVAMRWPG